MVYPERDCEAALGDREEQGIRAAEPISFWTLAGLCMAGVLRFDEPFGIPEDLTDEEAEAALRQIKSAEPERQRDLFTDV